MEEDGVAAEVDGVAVVVDVPRVVAYITQVINLVEVDGVAPASTAKST